MDYSLLVFIIFSNIYGGNCIVPGFLEPACSLGDIIQNSKTKCLCIDKSIYECFTITNGTKITGYTNQVPTKAPRNSGNEITDDDNKANKDISQIIACVPDAIYVEGNTTCVCTRKGTWPHKACLNLFGRLLDNPKNYTKCTPNSYVVVECNVCYCNNEGRIDKSRCTKKECYKETMKLTRKNFENNCEPNTWYSLSACQFCYCAEANKLVCNTGRYNSKRLELGTYNLTVCGSKFLEEAMELMPEEKHLRNTAAKTKPVLTVKNTDRLESQNRYNKITTKYSTTTRKQKTTKFAKSKKQKEYEYYSESEETSTYKTSMKIPASDKKQVLSENEDNLPSYDNHNDHMDKKHEAKNINNNYDTKNSVQEDEPAYKDQYVDSVSEKSNFDAHPKSKSNDDEDMLQFGDKTNKSNPMLTINIPNMISKVFNLRRSKGNATVVLKETKGKACKPGVMSVDGCNKCFCLKDGKLLCTDVTDC